MDLNLPYKTGADALTEVRTALEHHGHDRLFPLVYDRHRRDLSSVRWLTPTRSNPSFKFGKLIFSADRAIVPENRILCGFHVEKGFEGPVKERNQILRADWQWHAFLRDMDSTFASAVAAAAREIGSALSVWMVAKGYDAHEPADRISFNSDGERLRADRTQIGLNVIAPLAAADSWRDLRVRIDSLKEDAITWNWIDFYLGATFTLDPSRADDVGRCAVMLGHFMPWVQKS